ncbi:MAG: signal recognition particle receptor subunit alpha, partial [Campylobacter sp.]|nr:signal recognition particle receptor subunit alpha [Campylobacter sp.]
MFNFFKKGFDKTIEAMKSANSSNKITKENLEEMLLEADVSYEIVEEILYYLPPQNEVKKDDLKRVLKTYFMYENKPLPQVSP